MSLKDFAIMEQLGQGSYAKVFKVLRHTDNKIYALKQIHIDKLDQKSKQNALNQVRFLASFNCKSIIKYYEAFFEENLNLLCIVMQHANDGDLSKLISLKKQKKQRFYQVQIWKILISLIHGLQYLHSRSILHRDIKPQNIFVVNGQYKIGDLNVSKLNNKLQAKLTQIGTPFYASPQIWQNSPYDNKCDVWSLGCLMYQVSALTVPFSAKSMDKLYEQIMHGKIRPIPKVYSDQLGKIINRCLQKQAEKRISIKQLHDNFTVKMYENLYYTSLELEKEEEKSKYVNLLKTINFQKYLKIKDIQLPSPHYETSSSQKQKQIQKQELKNHEKVELENKKFSQANERQQIIINHQRELKSQNSEGRRLNQQQSKKSMVELLLGNKKAHKQRESDQRENWIPRSNNRQKISIKEPEYKINSSFDRLLNKNKKNKHRSQISIPKFGTKTNKHNKNISRQQIDKNVSTTRKALQIQDINNNDRQNEETPFKNIKESIQNSKNNHKDTLSKRSLHRTEYSANKLHSIDNMSYGNSKINSQINSKINSINNSGNKKNLGKQNQCKEVGYRINNFQSDCSPKNTKPNQQIQYINQSYNYKNMLMQKLPKNNHILSLYNKNPAIQGGQNHIKTERKTKKRTIQDVLPNHIIKPVPNVNENNYLTKLNKMSIEVQYKAGKSKGKIFSIRDNYYPDKMRSIHSNILG